MIIESGRNVKIILDKKKNRKNSQFLICSGYPECIENGAKLCDHFGLHFKTRGGCGGGCGGGYCNYVPHEGDRIGRVRCEQLDSENITRFKGE